ncbi:MAG: phosphotransferase [Ilumatobacter sp.]|uniref:phosphotransferase enzyme family protein n=1 Tax=Ilumatobacter sp. TaxID=1967498 RepID=UPI00261DFEB5|nr:phosphotransferase [Ilumatobacter sp.]MDJ0767824.1 phosphotransferase [Ilumatobacter sp.]
MTAHPERFEELPVRAQVHRLRQVALRALGEYPIEPARVRLLAHECNTSFRVDTTDGRRFALRLGMAATSTSAQLQAETAWLTALARDTDVVVPVPLANSAGRLHTSAYCQSLDRELPVAVMSWLPGRDLDEPTPAAMVALGRITAHLHDHAERWRIPPGAGVPSHADVLVGEDDLLVAAHIDRPRADIDVVRSALRAAQDATDDAWSAGGERILHGDLHPWNVKWLRGRMSVFDFDDVLTGVPVQDLAISAYYLDDDAALRDALLAGYSEIRRLPAYEPEQFDALLAGRNLLLLNDVVVSQNADIRAIRERYVTNSITKLRAFLETGRYRHRVDGLLPTD